MDRSLSHFSRLPSNNTVKLPAVLQLRVAHAMLADGFTVWAEFCRVALTEKCSTTERSLRIADPAAFKLIYGYLPT
jgi:NADPH:quinone reductase-like Zn-dependent oxidoreductase